MRRAPLAAAEMVLIRLCHAADLPTPDEAIRMLPATARRPAAMRRLRARPARGASDAQRPPARRMRAPQSRARAAAASAPAEAGHPTSLQLRRRDRPGERRARHRCSSIALERHVRPVRFEPGQIEIALTPTTPTRRCRSELAQALKAWTGERWMVAVEQARAAARRRRTRRGSAAKRPARRGARRSAGAGGPGALPRRRDRRACASARIDATARAGRRSGNDPDDPDDEQRRRLAMKDLMGMMKQAKELQEKMQSLQAEIAALEATGASGGGLVTVTVDGKGGLKRCKIDPSLAQARGDRDPRGPDRRRRTTTRAARWRRWSPKTR